MNREELQAQSAADVKEVQALMESKGIRVEARQRIDTQTGFIELVAIFVSEKRLEEDAPAGNPEPQLVQTTEAPQSHADLADQP